MKSTFAYTAFFLIFSIGITPGFSFNNVQMDEILSPNSDSIKVRLGSTRRLRSGDEAGIPKGRYSAGIIHKRGLCEDYFSTNCRGEIKRNIDFVKNDRVSFKSNWIRKPLIVTNHLDSQDSTSLTSSIEVAMNKSDSTRYIFGNLRGKLFDFVKYEEILIYANGNYIGNPNSFGDYEAPTDENGKINLAITINSALVRTRALVPNIGKDCSEVDCANLEFNSQLDKECCNTIITHLDIETGDDKRAKIDISYDDDQSIRKLFRKLNLSSNDINLR